MNNNKGISYEKTVLLMHFKGFAFLFLCIFIIYNGVKHHMGQ